MDDRDAWWEEREWWFNGREVAVRFPREPYLSVICIPSTLELGDYIVELHNRNIGKRREAEIARVGP